MTSAPFDRLNVNSGLQCSVPLLIQRSLIDGRAEFIRLGEKINENENLGE